MVGFDRVGRPTGWAWEPVTGPASGRPGADGMVSDIAALIRRGVAHSRTGCGPALFKTAQGLTTRHWAQADVPNRTSPRVASRYQWSPGTALCRAPLFKAITGRTP